MNEQNTITVVDIQYRPGQKCYFFDPAGHTCEKGDYVIIDTPPVNIVTDATVLAEKVTGYIFVTQAGKNHTRDITDAVHQLEDMNANIVGFVLNDPANEAENHYGYRYKRYYRSNNYRYGPDVSASADKKKGG